VWTTKIRWPLHAYFKTDRAFLLALTRVTITSSGTDVKLQACNARHSGIEVEFATIIRNRTQSHVANWQCMIPDGSRSLVPEHFLSASIAALGQESGRRDEEDESAKN
jgi:hypothetical protein